MTFPLAQFFAIYTLVTILQQFHAIGTSPGMQLLLGATILLNVVSSIVLLYFMRKMYQKEQEEQKIRFFEEYETLSKQYQTQAEQASQQVAELRHDFDNQMQVFSGLMQSDAVEDAMQLAKELQTRFQDQKLKLQYCENTIANVILQQTAETCRKKQINFEVRCSLPEMLNIRRVDLCSLLINPLQNAIQASEKVPEENGRSRAASGRKTAWSFSASETERQTKSRCRTANSRPQSRTSPDTDSASTSWNTLQSPTAAQQMPAMTTSSSPLSFS